MPLLPSRKQEIHSGRHAYGDSLPFPVMWEGLDHGWSSSLCLPELRSPGRRLNFHIHVPSSHHPQLSLAFHTQLRDSIASFTGQLQCLSPHLDEDSSLQSSFHVSGLVFLTKVQVQFCCTVFYIPGDYLDLYTII